MAAITKRIKIGQIVTMQLLSSSIFVGKNALDIISNGRVELGIEAGWYEQEYKAYGYDFRLCSFNDS